MRNGAQEETMAKEDKMFTMSLAGLTAGVIALSCAGASLSGAEGGMNGMAAFAAALVVTSVMGFLLGSSLFGREERHLAAWTALAALVMAFFLVVYGTTPADFLKGAIVLGLGCGVAGSAAVSFCEYLVHLEMEERLAAEK